MRERGMKTATGRRMMRGGVRGAIVTLLGIAVTGCSVIPGMKVDAADPSVVGPEPDIRRIDGELVERIARRERSREDAESQDDDTRSDYQYRVGTGDVLSVVVWNHPELTNPFGEGASAQNSGRLVHQDGTLFFPYVGPIEAAGKTTQQIQNELVEGLRPYVQQPQVNVRVQEFRSKQAYVTGQIRGPGPLPVTDKPLTILDAISGAGGFVEGGGGSGGSFGANARQALLTRDGETVSIDLRSLYATGAGNRVLRDGDILHVPDDSANKIFVMGEVQRQTTVRLHNGELSLAEAIASADGIDLQTADTEEIYVIRGVPVQGDDGEQARIEPRIFQLDASNAASMLLADAFPMQPRDVVYVSAPGIVRWNRVLQQIMPSIRSAYQLRIIESGFDSE